MGDPAQAFRAAILAALGNAPDVIELGRLHRFATGGRRGDLAGWCKLFPDGRGGIFGDWRSGITETWRDDRPLTRTERADLARQIEAATHEREAEQRRRWAENCERITRIWSQCVPLVPGDPVTLYLKGRGFGGVWPLPNRLRLHRALPYWNAEGEKLGDFPAMVAPVISRGGFVAVHRTYLTPDGRKADVPEVKKLTPAAGPLAGACIPLHQPRDCVIGIAEGIETALAAWCASAVPTVAAYCAGNLAAWQWPTGVGRLVVFGDNDRAGREAAASLQRRARTAGLSCDVLTPTDEGADWCDVWTARGAVTIKGAAA